MYISTYLYNYVSDTRVIRFAIPADFVTLMAVGHLWHLSRNWKRNVRDPYLFCSCNRVKDDVLTSVSWCLRFCKGLSIIIIIILAKFHVTFDFHGCQSLMLTHVLHFLLFDNTEKRVSLNQRNIFSKKKCLWIKESFVVSNKISLNQQNFLQFKDIFSLTVYQRNCFLGEQKIQQIEINSFSTSFAVYNAIKYFSFARPLWNSSSFNNSIWFLLCMYNHM